MKTMFITLTLLVLIALFACKTGQSTEKQPIHKPLTGITSAEEQELLLKYREEGFVDQNTYAIIIVRSAENGDSFDDIQEQAEKRAYVSFQKYMRQNDLMVSANTQSHLLAIIDEFGSIRKIDDTEQSRTVYIFLVEKEGLKRQIDTLK